MAAGLRKAVHSQYTSRARSGDAFTRDGGIDRRASESRRVFASYRWNDAQTEAVLAAPDGVRAVADVAPGKSHSIPGVADCAACHGTKRPDPLGFNALQLSTDRDPNAIHGEPLAPGTTTPATLTAPGCCGPRVRSSSPRRAGFRRAIPRRARCSATFPRTVGRATTAPARSGRTRRRCSSRICSVMATP